MKYPNGEEVCVGDRVRLGDDSSGIVVCSIDADTYSKDHPREKWSYLGGGVVIEFLAFGLIHFVEPEHDLALIERAVTGAAW